MKFKPWLALALITGGLALLSWRNNRKAARWVTRKAHGMEQKVTVWACGR